MKDTLYTLSVFTDANGESGDPLTVVIDTEQSLDETKRMTLAKEFGGAETAFIDTTDPVRVSFYNHATGRVAFAGQPMVGVASLLHELTKKTEQIILCDAGEVRTWQEGEITWVAKDTSGLPGWKMQQFSSVDEVNAVKLPETATWQHTVIWAWENETAGQVRMRTFAADWGVPEVASNGSGAMLLASQLNRRLEIDHGHGSVLYAQPLEDGLIALGGRCRLVNSKEF